MMKVEGVFLDYHNYEQLQWFFKEGAKKANWKLVDKIVDTATGKAVGAIYHVKGWGAGKVIKEAAKFHHNPVRMEFNV